MADIDVESLQNVNEFIQAPAPQPQSMLQLHHDGVLGRGVHPIIGIIALSSYSLENQIFGFAKTKTHISCAVTAQLISDFVFATQIVQFIFFLNMKFQASSRLL